MELLSGLQAALHWSVLLSIAAGSLLGIFVGVLPGLGPIVAISVCLPFTYGMPPLAGLSLLLGIYCGAFYGGAVTSILIKTPGEASSIMTMFDGYPMARRGEAERALSLAFASAFVGGIVSALFLAFAAPQLAKFTTQFGAAEFTCAAVLAAICVCRAYSKQFVEAVLMVGLGLFIGTVGIDATSSEQRFVFGSSGLMSGLPLVSVAIGMFGMAQGFVLLGSKPRSVGSNKELENAGVSLKHFVEPFRYPRTLSKSVLIGLLIGVLPAVGAALSTSLAYFAARKGSKSPETFGKGNPEGIIAAEAANNSNSGGAMVTVLTLGIPGDAITAVMMGVFLVHGVFPGPNLFAEQPQLVNGVFASMMMINVAILVILLLLVKYIAMLVKVDPRILGIGILTLCFVGAYSVSNSFYEVWIAFGFGIFGWFCALSGLPAVPLVLGMVIGDLLESSMRQALSISEGSFLIFLQRPASAALTVAGILMLGWPLLQKMKTLRKA
ncbi:tripartite tricarboxylate transporter permease [Variovorax sp. J31P179]|uniref:tripartite tricarboxylate transporter permease n=1 Tax=Variovorax sp. J31P179 TaxID=3053508 RepID=UPI00257554AB|nr:tripartite tricarboxylate transporter permease [Variovorax sp. J31P179]MDM0084715.1 tripartite tricarboxylate transporter permease [Variovorax sp. J31P179]